MLQKTNQWNSENMNEMQMNIDAITMIAARGPQTNCQQVIDDELFWFTGYWQLGLGTPARFSTGASREAPVDNECFSIWQLGLGTQA